MTTIGTSSLYSGTINGLNSLDLDTLNVADIDATNITSDLFIIDNIEAVDLEVDNQLKLKTGANILIEDGNITISDTEVSRLDGVSSNIQTQLADLQSRTQNITATADTTTITDQLIIDHTTESIRLTGNATYIRAEKDNGNENWEIGNTENTGPVYIKSSNNSLLYEAGANTNIGGHFFNKRIYVQGTQLTNGDIAQIDTNKDNIATGAALIAINTSNISTNTSNISTNTTAIATNTSNISTNTSNISTNTSNISTNTTAIATNTGNISTNTSNISTNTTNIATNTTNIATNTTAIAAIDTTGLAKLAEISYTADNFFKFSGGRTWNVNPVNNSGYYLTGLTNGFGSNFSTFMPTFTNQATWTATNGAADSGELHFGYATSNGFIKNFEYEFGMATNTKVLYSFPNSGVMGATSGFTSPSDNVETGTGFLNILTTDTHYSVNYKMTSPTTSSIFLPWYMGVLNDNVSSNGGRWSVANDKTNVEPLLAVDSNGHTNTVSLEVQANGDTIKVSSGDGNIAFFAQDKTTRKGDIGMPSSESGGMLIKNYGSNKDIKINTTGSGDVLINSRDVLAELTTNAANIATNTANISTSTSDIASLVSQQNTNTTAIASNLSAIQSNDTDIATLNTNLTALTAAVTANTTAIQNAVPSGTIMAWGGASQPTGFLLCDGQSLNPNLSTYTALYAAIGDNYANGRASGTGAGVFYIPDLRGIFPKGAGTNTTYTGTTSTTLGAFQSCSVQDHIHVYERPYQSQNVSGQGYGSTESVYDNVRNQFNTTGPTKPDSSALPSLAETRPNCLGVNYMIKI